jgi:hypothetical protein
MHWVVRGGDGEPGEWARIWLACLPVPVAVGKVSGGSVRTALRGPSCRPEEAATVCWFLGNHDSRRTRASREALALTQGTRRVPVRRPRRWCA